MNSGKQLLMHLTEHHAKHRYICTSINNNILTTQLTYEKVHHQLLGNNNLNLISIFGVLESMWSEMNNRLVRFCH